MTLKKYSPNPFSAMFRNSCKKIAFIPILTFVLLFICTLKNYFNIIYIRGYGKDNTTVGFFWSSLSTDMTSVMIEWLLGLSGILAGIILFSFVLSKKKCNVVFSIGLSRKKIFLSNYIAGILPFYAAVIIAAFFEILSVYCCGYKPTKVLMEVALYYVLSYMAIYTLSFTVTSAAISFSGNIVESAVFTGIIGLVPYFANIFFGDMRNMFTLGGIGVYDGSWNFFNPYFYMFKFTSGYSSYDIGDYNISDYFTKNVDGTMLSRLTLLDFSGAIMDFVYAGIIFAIAYLMFGKRKNEIAGTFGRAKGLNEICGVIVGFYAVTLCSLVLIEESDSHGNGNLKTFLILLLSFVIAYFVFRIIFAYKRKRILKRTLKIIPAYAAILAIVTVVFSTGFLGYSSRIPNADDVEKIDFSVDVTNPYSVVDDGYSLHRDVYYGYAPMKKAYSTLSTGLYSTLFSGHGDSTSTYLSYTSTSEEEINKLIEIHKSFVKSGKIKNSASTACGINFEITYTLKDGSTVKRYYTETNEENAKAILGLSDFNEVKNLTQNYFDSFDDENEYSEEYLDYTNNYFYLYTKDLTKSHRCAVVTDELKNAVLADIKNQSSEEIFLHSADDELGVISFGISVEQYYDSIFDDSNYYNSSSELVDSEIGQTISFDETAKAELEKMGDDPELSVSLTSYTTKYIVLTKDMVNTIKYLTDNDYMQYLESDVTANDVAKIKLATKSESVNMDNSQMLPLFAAGYSTAASVKSSDKIFCYFDTHYFDTYVNNEITNKSTIQKILDSSFLYGYCGNDYRIVEVTFNDGSIATYCITGEDYSNLMK